MSSSADFEPPIWGWKSTLSKSGSSYAQVVGELRYIDDTYCEITRQSVDGFRILLALFAVGFSAFGLVVLIISSCLSTGIYFNATVFWALFCGYCGMYTLLHVALPFLYQDVFSPRGMPIRFNRKTRKVYIADSLVSPLKLLYNPLKLLKPFSHRYVEFNWYQIEAGLISSHVFYAGGGGGSARHHILCLVCDDNKDEIDRFVLQFDMMIPDTSMWNWICNYMVFNDDELNIEGNLAPYTPRSPLARKLFSVIAPDPKWPAWMEQAKQIEQLTALITLKQQYGLDVSGDEQLKIRIEQGKHSEPNYYQERLLKKEELELNVINEQMCQRSRAILEQVQQLPKDQHFQPIDLHLAVSLLQQWAQTRPAHYQLLKKINKVTQERYRILGWEDKICDVVRERKRSDKYYFILLDEYIRKIKHKEVMQKEALIYAEYHSQETLIKNECQKLINDNDKLDYDHEESSLKQRIELLTQWTKKQQELNELRSKYRPLLPNRLLLDDYLKSDYDFYDTQLKLAQKDLYALQQNKEQAEKQAIYLIKKTKIYDEYKAIMERYNQLPDDEHYHQNAVELLMLRAENRKQQQALCEQYRAKLRVFNPRLCEHKWLGTMEEEQDQQYEQRLLVHLAEIETQKIEAEVALKIKAEKQERKRIKKMKILAHKMAQKEASKKTKKGA